MQRNGTHNIMSGKFAPVVVLLLGVLPFGLLACGDERETLTPLPLERGAVVSGTVLTAGGRPQEGAVVSLERLEDGLPAAVREALGTASGGKPATTTPAATGPLPLTGDALRVTTTDRTGRFTFAGLVDGDYLLEARAGHHRTAGRNIRIPALLAPTMAETTFVDIALQPTGTFSGQAYLWGATNFQSTVVYIPNSSSVAVTDMDGDYILRDVPIGAHTIIATHESWLDASTNGALAAAGDSVALPPMELPRTWNMAPIVTASAPATGEVDVPVFFDVTASDPDGVIVNYEWDFDDDGQVDYSNQVSGDINASLAGESQRAKVRVTDDDGAIAIAVVNIIIYEAVYVSPTGSDANPGLRASPKATPAQGLALAATLTRPENRRLFLALGTYSGVPALNAGTVNISGGHDPGSWLRTAGQRSILNMAPGANLTKDGSATSVTYLVGLDVRQTTAADKPCVLLNGTSSLSVTDCRFQAAPGVTGTDGPSGNPGPSGTAGAPGQGGSSNSPSGGLGGTGASPGGAGGLGGYNGSGTAGQNGPEGAPGGAGGTVSSGCGDLAGQGGTGTNGAAGGAGANAVAAGSGITVGSTIEVSAGSSGFFGSPGRSGGGGGGGGGGITSFPCTADRAGGGGEGGGGGSPGFPGTGGVRGGCSVAVLLVVGAGVSVPFTDCILVSANAGNGGNGGDGGAGGGGGTGGSGGPGADDAAAGGKGGNGGSGGAAGGGSGGAGGWSIGIVVKGAGTWTPTNSPITVGNAGAGGAGGRLGGTGAQAPSGPNGSATQVALVP